MVYPSQTTDRTKLELAEAPVPRLHPKRVFLLKFCHYAERKATLKEPEGKIKHSITAPLVLPSYSHRNLFSYFVFCFVLPNFVLM